MRFTIFLIFVIHLHYCFAYDVNANFTLHGNNIRCNYNMHRFEQTSGVGGLNTLEACAEYCYNSQHCAAFGHLSSGAQRCDIYYKTCITDGRYEAASGSALYFSTILKPGIEHYASDRFTRVGELTACKDVFRNPTGVSAGAFGDNTLEGCATECFQSDTCAAFSHKAYSTRTFKCEFYTRECKADEKDDYPNNFESINESDLWAANYVTDWPHHLPTPLLTLFEADTFNILDDRYFFPEATRCGAHTFDFSANPPDALTYGQMYCDGVVDGGFLQEYSYVYPADIFRHDICAKLCHHYNSVPRSIPCRGFNVVYDDATNTFKCSMYSCNIYDKNIRFNATTNSNNTFGFLDTLSTPLCNAENYANEDEYMLARDYEVHFRQHCTSNIFVRYNDVSAIECAKMCDQYSRCAGFEIRDDRECKIQRKCNSMSESTRHSFYYSKVNHTKGSYDKEGNNDLLLLLEKRGRTCTNSAGKIATYTDKATYEPKECHERCVAAPTCTTFEVNSNWHCIIYSVCDTVETYPTASAIDQVFEYTTESQNLARLSLSHSPPLTGMEGGNWCTSTSDCISGFYDICTPQYQCQEFVCSNHQQCFGTVREGRLPMCDLKKRRCVDYYPSDCLNSNQCLNEARIKWKDRSALAAARTEMQLSKSEARISYLTRLSEELQTLQVPDNVYVAIRSNETIDIQVTTPVQSVDDFLYQIRLLRCGTLLSSCNAELVTTTPQRRMLLESYTVTLVFDVDDQLLQDLINSGYDLNNTEFITQLANTLNVTEQDLFIEAQDGTIELTATIIDNLGVNDTLSDDLIDEINSIQQSLDQITLLISQELGFTSSLQSTDYCGDRTCNGRGICDINTGYCDCDVGFYGVDCQFDTPYPTTAPTMSPIPDSVGCYVDEHCQNNGRCVTRFQHCECLYPYYGKRCESTINCEC